MMRLRINGIYPPRKTAVVFMAKQKNLFVKDFTSKGPMELFYEDRVHSAGQWIDVWHCESWSPLKYEWPWDTMSLNWKKMERMINSRAMIHSLAIRADGEMALFVHGQHILNFLDDKMPEETKVRNSPDTMMLLQMPIVKGIHEIYNLRMRSDIDPRFEIPTNNYFRRIF